MSTLHDLRNENYKRLNDMLLYVELETDYKSLNENDEVIIEIEGKAIKYLVAAYFQNKYRLVFLNYI